MSRPDCGSLGRPEGFLERQVAQWLAKLESYARLDGYPGHAIPYVAEVAGWIERTRPVASAPGIMHGDFHLANLLFERDSPEVAAIVDWEMSTIGDPLLDLGWLLATWPNDEWCPLPGAVCAAGGLPRPDELVTRYAEQGDRDASRADWYQVLACLKLAVVLEGTHARACAGKAPRSVGETLHATAVQLLDRARAVIDHGTVV